MKGVSIMALPARITARTYSPEEFEALPEFDDRYELIDGKLVKKTMPGGEHGSIARRIYKRLTLFDPDDKFGEMWFDTTFNVGTGWMPIPDLAYVVANHVPAISRKALNCVPDLVVEIHSPTDLLSNPERLAARRKIKDWQGVGVLIIWAIDPARKIVEVFHPDQPEPVQQAGLSDTLDGEDVIPGFSLKVAEIFGQELYGK
jgi:Uma2 family endonuclease